MIYVILISYIAVTFLASLWGVNKKKQTPESYFLADRNLGILALFFTILATNFSAFFFLGFAGEGYRIGFAYYIMMAGGTSLAAVAFFVLGTRIWKLGKDKGYITPAELIYGETGSRSLSMIFSLVMILFTLPYLALQLIGGGYILENLTDGQVSYELSIIILSLITFLYVLIGGMSSVAKTDLKQGLLMILFMLMAVLMLSSNLGGFSEANRLAAEVVPDIFSMGGVGGHYSTKKWISWIIFWFFCIPMFPQLFIRFYIAKDIKTLKRSALMYAIIPWLISCLPVIIGIWGHTTFPGLIGKEADQILPMMLIEYAHPWFAALIMTGAIAAFMSTLDSQLLSLSTMITRDIVIPIQKKKWNFDQEIRFARWMVGLLALLGLMIAFRPFDTIFDMGKMAFSGLAILFPIAFFTIRFTLIRPLIAVAAILVSLIGLAGFHYKIIPTDWAFGFEPFMLLILLSFILSGLATSFTKKENTAK